MKISNIIRSCYPLLIALIIFYVVRRELLQIYSLIGTFITPVKFLLVVALALVLLSIYWLKSFNKATCLKCGFSIHKASLQCSRCRHVYAKSYYDCDEEFNASIIRRIGLAKELIIGAFKFYLFLCIVFFVGGCLANYLFLIKIGYESGQINWIPDWSSLALAKGFTLFLFFGIDYFMGSTHIVYMPFTSGNFDKPVVEWFSIWPPFIAFGGVIMYLVDKLKINFNRKNNWKEENEIAIREASTMTEEEENPRLIITDIYK